MCRKTLRAPRIHDARLAIIFGLHDTGPNTNKELLPEATRAFLRHAYNQFYHDFSNVDLKNINFVWQRTYRNAIRSLQNAVLAYGMRIRLLFDTRLYSTLNGVAPKETRQKFTTLIDINEEGCRSFRLTPDFQAEIDRAETQHNDITQQMIRDATQSRNNPQQHP